MIEQVQTFAGPLKVPGVLPKLSRTPGRIGEGGPQLGEHTDDVLAGLGLTDEQRRACANAGSSERHAGWTRRSLSTSQQATTVDG